MISSSHYTVFIIVATKLGQQWTRASNGQKKSNSQGYGYEKLLVIDPCSPPSQFYCDDGEGYTDGPVVIEISALPPNHLS